MKKYLIILFLLIPSLAFAQAFGGAFHSDSDPLTGDMILQNGEKIDNATNDLSLIHI